MILVTGARGHIGNNLVYELSRIFGKSNIRIFVRSKKGIEYVTDYASEVFEGDIADASDVDNAVKGCEYVFHIAAIITLSKKLTDKVIASNVLGTRNIVEACLRNGIKRLIYTSSVEALKDMPKGSKISERLTDIDQTIYGAYAKSKIMANAEITKGIINGLDAVTVYPSAVIGPRDYKGSYAQKIIKLYSSKFFIKVYFKGAYNFVDVRDVVGAMIKAMTGETSCGGDYILAGECREIKDIARIIGDAMGRKNVYIRLPLFLVNFFAGISFIFSKIFNKESAFNPYSVSILKRNCDFLMDNAKRDLDFEPRDISTTFIDTVNWLKENK